jgi:hypothetical protein
MLPDYETYPWQVMDYNSPEARLSRTFMPYAFEASQRLDNSRKRLVHYTSAENAFRIIRNKEFWLRRTSEMNDYTEVVHGYNCLWDAMKGDVGKKFITTLKDIVPKAFDEVNHLFTGWEPMIFLDTYIGCLSEEEAREDELGRLSMWRAYGAGGGVAIFMPGRFFLEPNDHINAFTSPVAYMARPQVEEQLAAVTSAISAHADELRSSNHDHLVGLIFNMLRFAVICTKHEGFREETEWRILHTAGLDEGRLKPTVELINGMPQPVVKIPLSHTADHPTGIELSELFEKILIGPARSQSTIREGLIMALNDAGVPNPKDRVLMSNIPLRA